MGKLFGSENTQPFGHDKDILKKDRNAEKDAEGK